MTSDEMPTDEEILKLALNAIRGCRQKRGLADDVAGMPAAEDQAQEVWLKWNRQTESVQNPAAWINTAAQNLVFDDFRKVQTARDAQPGVAQDVVVAKGDSQAGTQLGLLLEQLAPRERRTLTYYFSNHIDFPNDDRKVLPQQAADLQISKEALSKSLNRIRQAAADLNFDIDASACDSTTPVTFNADDFLTIRPLINAAGEIVLELGLPATLSEPPSRKAPDRTLLSEVVFRTLLPISLTYALRDDAHVSADSDRNDAQALRGAAAALRDDLADVPRFELVLCQTLQLLARVLIDTGHAASIDDLLIELRERLKSPVVRTSTRAVELHAALHEIENQHVAARPFVR